MFEQFPIPHPMSPAPFPQLPVSSILHMTTLPPRFLSSCFVLIRAGGSLMYQTRSSKNLFSRPSTYTFVFAVIAPCRPPVLPSRPPVRGLHISSPVRGHMPALSLLHIHSLRTFVFLPRTRSHTIRKGHATFWRAHFLLIVSFTARSALRSRVFDWLVLLSREPSF